MTCEPLWLGMNNPPWVLWQRGKTRANDQLYQSQCPGCVPMLQPSGFFCERQRPQYRLEFTFFKAGKALRPAILTIPIYVLKNCRVHFIDLCCGRLLILSVQPATESPLRMASGCPVVYETEERRCINEQWGWVRCSFYISWNWSFVGLVPSISASFQIFANPRFSISLVSEAESSQKSVAIDKERCGTWFIALRTGSSSLLVTRRRIRKVVRSFNRSSRPIISVARSKLAHSSSASIMISLREQENFWP